MNEEIESQIKLEDDMKEMANIIHQFIKREYPTYGFALIMFQFNAPGISHYISSAERGTMIEALRETADRLEKKQDLPPGNTTIQ